MVNVRAKIFGIVGGTSGENVATLLVRMLVNILVEMLVEMLVGMLVGCWLKTRKKCSCKRWVQC